MTRKNSNTAGVENTHAATPFWFKLLPLSVKTRLFKSPQTLLVITNIGWLFGDKMLRMFAGIVLTIWMARYLGPAQFGSLNYVIAFVAIFSPIASLGLADVVVRDLVKDPHSTQITLGTAFFLEVMSGTLASTLAVFGIYLTPSADKATRDMVLILSITLIFRATEVIKYWYQARVVSRQTVWIESSLFTIFFLLKILFIVKHYPIEYFIWAMLVEALSVAIGLSIRYSAHVGVNWKWKISSQRAKTLFGDSWPLLLSSGFVLLNLNVDKVMLGIMRGNSEVGLFSAASKLTEAWYFVPVIICASVAPRLTQLFQHERQNYYRVSQSVFNLLSGVAITVCILTTILSPWVVRGFYGSGYDAASPMLTIHVWTSLFVFHASMRTQMLVIEHMKFFVLAFSLLTLIANIGINFMLIPIAGGIGSSYASLISWIMCALIFPLLFRRTRSFPLQFFFISSPGARKNV